MKVYAHFDQYPKDKWRWADFSPREIACRGDDKLAIDESAMDRLQRLRNLLGRPMIIHSAYRSPEHNRRVGGAKGSMHLQARAFDVSMADHDTAEFEKAAREAGFTGFGFYPHHNFIHIDTGRPRSWGQRWEKKRDAPVPAALISAPHREDHYEPEGGIIMYGEKAWYQSKTIWGALVALGSQAALFFGVEIGPEDQAAILNSSLQIVAALGALFAIYGRLSATDTID